MTAARAEYLFALAHICHVSPAEVDGMTVADFGRLTLGVDAYQDSANGEGG